MAGIGGICVAVGLFAYAPSASASTVSADALAHVAYGGTASSGLEWAGTVVDPALGNGGGQRPSVAPRLGTGAPRRWSIRTGA